MSAAAPPSYPTDAPPSYEDVTRKLDGLIGSNLTTPGVLEAAKNLSDADIDVLVENHDRYFPIKTDEQKAKFAQGLAKASSSDDVQVYLQAAAQAASATAKSIKSTFVSVQFNLGQVDKRFNTTFEPRFIGIHQSFQSVLDESRTLATKTYTRASMFDKVDISFCDDSSKDIGVRQEKIKKNVENFQELQTLSSGLDTKMNTVSTSLGSLITEFVAFAQDKEGELTEKLKQIKADLISLEGQLRDAETAQATWTHFSQGFLGITGALSAAFPPYSTAIAIGGILFSALSLHTTTGMVTRISQLKGRIAEKTKEKGELEADLEAIREAREKLEQTGTANVDSFRACIKALPALSMPAVQDAKEIQTWLHSGLLTAESRPAYMQLNRTEDVRSYDSMGQYLREYGRGITSICTPESIKDDDDEF